MTRSSTLRERGETPRPPPPARPPGHQPQARPKLGGKEEKLGAPPEPAARPPLAEARRSPLTWDKFPKLMEPASGRPQAGGKGSRPAPRARGAPSTDGRTGLAAGGGSGTRAPLGRGQAAL